MSTNASVPDGAHIRASLVVDAESQARTLFGPTAVGAGCGVMGELVEIGEVARTRPTADAPPEVLAAWYRRKAAMLRRLGANYYRQAAVRAEARARALVPGVVA